VDYNSNFPQTRVLTQAQGMITQLVFEHALRIRMKSEPSESPPSQSQPSTSVPTPDTASVVESTSGHSPDGTVVTEGASTTLVSEATPSEVDKSSIKGEERKPVGEKGGNLVGKINNLVSTDLNNIIDGRDFLMIAVACPIQIILCVVFLHTILGWRYVDRFYRLPVYRFDPIHLTFQCCRWNGDHGHPFPRAGILRREAADNPN
jgi:hypothetical protein